MYGAQIAQCHHARAWAAALERIARNPIARRELLWLRASEKEDLEAIRLLERADPKLGERVRPLAEAIARDVGENRHDRQAAYARQWNERFQHHAPELAAVECNCPSCTDR